MNLKPESKGFPRWAGILLILVVIGLAGYLIYSSGTKGISIATTSPSPVASTIEITPSSSGSPSSKASPGAETKTYTEKRTGVSFSYPGSWLAIEGVGIGEGSGVQESTIQFAVDGGPNGAKLLNDVSITIYPKPSTDTGGYDDVYKSVLEHTAIQGAKKAAAKIGSLPATRYSNLGGMISNPEVVISDKGATYFITVTNEHGGKAQVEETQFSRILASFKFAK